MKDDEQNRMAEMTGFKIKFQEAGGSVLANSFDKGCRINTPSLNLWVKRRMKVVMILKTKPRFSMKL